MRLVATILICAEVLLVFALVSHPILTSHKPLAAAINNYRAAPSPTTEAEVKRLQEAARFQGRDSAHVGAALTQYLHPTHSPRSYSSAEFTAQSCPGYRLMVKGGANQAFQATAGLALLFFLAQRRP